MRRSIHATGTRTQLCAAMLMVVVAMLLPAPSHAYDNDQPYNAGRSFGLGAVVGDPTGVTGEQWLANSRALDFAAAWSLDENNSMDLSADHVWYDFDALGTERHSVALHYGLGGRALLRDHADDHIGLRMPVGLTWFADGGRVGLFMQVAPVLDVTPSTDMTVQGGVGARYFLP